jgi:hypothetical protein
VVLDRRRIRWALERRRRLGNPGLRFIVRLQGVEMLFLQFGQLADVMSFAGGENENETGECRERRKPRTKHAREE